MEACNNCGCCPYNNNNNNNNNKETPNVPYLYQSCLNKNQPFGYEDSNLKNLYLSREQLATIKAEPITFKLQ